MCISEREMEGSHPNKPHGLYEPLVMFFGLTNSLATFQTMMNELFKELINEGVVVVFIDDILIFMESLEDHWKIV